MKTKILVAMIACLAIGACSKSETQKEESKSETTTTTTQPAGEAGKTDAAPGTGTTTPAAPAGGHSSIESTTNVLAADETAAQQPTAAQDADKKLQDMKQDMSSTANQIQGSTTSTEAKADAHNHAED